MNCSLCPRNCAVDRRTQAGFCGVRGLRIARADLHFFEEPPISGTRGSGTIFFCGCSLRCAFCQNFTVSRNLTGADITVKRLAELCRELEARGAHNINLVTPTHYLEELETCFSDHPVSVPVVWNTHSYESVRTVQRAARFSDIFLADLKYFSPEISMRYAGVPDYFERAMEAIETMVACRPDVYDEDGMMRSGVIIRHLILPQNVDETVNILRAIKREFPQTTVSLMAQYTPFGDLSEFPELQRKITRREYERACAEMSALNLKGFLQERSSGDRCYIPDWNFQD